MGSFVKAIGAGGSGILNIFGDTQRVNTEKSGLEAERSNTERGANELRQGLNLALQDYAKYQAMSPRTIAMLESATTGEPVTYTDPNKYIIDRRPDGVETKVFLPQVSYYNTESPYSIDDRFRAATDAETKLAAAEQTRRQEGAATLADLANYTYQRNQAPQNFNYQVDPGFRFMQNEQNRILNQQLAGRGKYFSGRAVDETLGNANQRLVGNMYDTLYNRNIAEADSKYGRGVNLGLQRLGESNSLFDIASNAYSRKVGEATNRYGLGQELDEKKYDRLYSLAGIGSNADTAAATMKFNSGTNLSNLYGKLGASQALGYSRLADARAARYGNMAKWNYQMASDAGDGVNQMMSMYTGGR